MGQTSTSLDSTGTKPCRCCPWTWPHVKQRAPRTRSGSCATPRAGFPMRRYPQPLIVAPYAYLDGLQVEMLKETLLAQLADRHPAVVAEARRPQPLRSPTAERFRRYEPSAFILTAIRLRTCITSQPKFTQFPNPFVSSVNYRDLTPSSPQATQAQQNFGPARGVAGCPLGNPDNCPLRNDGTRGAGAGAGRGVNVRQSGK